MGSYMTRYTEEDITQMKKEVIGKSVTNFYYEPDGDYYVMEFEGGFETSFRFMADIYST